MCVDLLSVIERFNAKSPHHRAAINLLADSLPKELLAEDADWVVLFENQVIELTYNEKRS